MIGRIFRGGSWIIGCRLAQGAGHPNCSFDHVGFRIAKKRRQVDKVLRGGSWIFSQAYVRAAVRVWYEPGGRLVDYGFRIARRKRL